MARRHVPFPPRRVVYDGVWPEEGASGYATGCGGGGGVVEVMLEVLVVEEDVVAELDVVVDHVRLRCMTRCWWRRSC